MEKEKGPLVSIEYHYHNHVDTAEILSLLHTVKLQNNKIITLLLSTEDDQEKVEALARKLRRSTDRLKKAIAENTSLKT